jgi:hypothetical protein
VVLVSVKVVKGGGGGESLQWLPSGKVCGKLHGHNQSQWWWFSLRPHQCCYQFQWETISTLARLFGCL